MFGVKTDRGWLAPTMGPAKFFTFQQTSCYPFRSRSGANRVARDWLGPRGIRYHVHRFATTDEPNGR